MSRGLPPPWVRFGRHRATVLATVLAAAVAIAAGAVADAAHVQVGQEVDAHWRGAYDILVRPPGSHLGLERTAGVVEPNFLGFTGTGGITLDQLADIRALGDVSLAAPVAFIGYITTTAAAPAIHVAVWPAKPTLYLADLTVTTSDGVAPRLLFRQKFRVLLGPPPAVGEQPLALSDYGPPASVAQLDDGTWVADFSVDRLLPGISSPVLAVDPAAEEELLGSAGAGLARLAALADRTFTAKTFDQALLPREFAMIGMDLARLGQSPSSSSRPVFPVVVASSLGVHLASSLAVEETGRPIDERLDTTGAPSDVLDAAARLAGTGALPLGTSAADISGRLKPFAPEALVIGWPESGTSGGSVVLQRPSEFRPALSGRPAYHSAAAPLATPGLAFGIAPAGIVDVGGSSTLGSTAQTVATGSEQTYRTLAPVPNPLVKGFVKSAAWDVPFVFAPIGTVDMASLAPDRDPLAYVPLGAYDTTPTLLVADPSGVPVAPTVMFPTVAPTGLIQSAPTAIADLSAAVAFRGSAPIDAVRVRVAGLSGFDEAARARVERVATQIAAMGLDVDIVTGSSPQAVHVFVPAYDTSASPPADLGWVEQQWTTLGAATRVVRGLSDTNTALLGLATLAMVIVVGGLQVLLVATRRREAAVLASVGWARGARTLWQVGEPSVAGAIVAVAGLTAWASLGRSPSALAAVAVIAAAFPIAGLAAALIAPVGADALVSRGRGSAVLRRIRVGGIAGYSVRSLASRPGRTLVTILALGAASGTVGPAVALVGSVGLRVGPTLLAGAIGAQLAPYQVVLLVLTALGSVAFCLVALRASAAERASEFRALAASGWMAEDARRMLRCERVLTAVPAAAVGGVLASAVAVPVTGTMPVASVAAAVLLGLSVAVWGGLVTPAGVAGRLEGPRP